MISTSFTQVPSLTDIQSHLVLPSGNWTDQSKSPVSELKICKLGEHTRSCGVDGVVILTLVVKGDTSWTLNAHGKCLSPSTCSAISHFSRFVTPENVNDILQRLDKLMVCPGHPEERFVQMLKEKKTFKDGRTSAVIDDCADVMLNGETYPCTVRTSTCEMLIPTGKCSKCVSYRASLRTMYTRWQKSVASSPTRHTCSTSHTNFRYLSTPLKKKRMDSLRVRVTSAERKLDNLRKKIDASTKSKGVTVDDDLHQDLSKIVEEQTPSIHEQFPEGSFKRLFWEQQRQALISSSRQMRWHPTMIKWCLNIKLHSTAAYEAIRESGFISLPSTRTLRDYTHHIKSGTGFLPEVTEQLIKEAKIGSLKPHEKHVALCFDEVRIKDNLVYDKHGLQVIGYVDIGDINNELLKFEQTCKDEDGETPGSPLPVAKHMLVFMVRGLFIDLKFPFAQFATRTVTSDQLFPLAWEAVQKLEAADFKVTAFVCDGASQNRKFFRMHSNNSTETVYETSNPYASESRSIYFFSDAPHLIKTVRNCWANSFSHSSTRALWVSIMYMYLQTFY